MTQISSPSKQAVRDYMAERRKSLIPPETPERIREMLGWELVAAERAAGQKR